MKCKIVLAALAVLMLLLCTGALAEDFTIDAKGVITEYTGTAAEVIIPETIDGIKVTMIGHQAFRECSSLEKVMIPDGVTAIGNFAFHSCSSLTSIVIPDGITSFGRSAFYGCSNLTAITIPESVTVIGPYCFYNCSSLTVASVPSKVSVIDSSVFYGCTSLTTLDLPEKLTAIGSFSFYGCSSLSGVTIPDGVTSIGNSAFSGCTSLTGITIPDSTISIGSSAFNGCTGLQNVHTSSLERWLSIEFGDSSANPLMYAHDLYVNGVLLKEAAIPETITAIGSYAFCRCWNLTDISLHDRITFIGDSAFSGCIGLTNAVIPESVISIGKSAFSSCTSLSAIDLPESITTIEAYTFSGCTALTGITIPGSVTSIGNSAFERCSSLTSLILPDKVTTIGSFACLACYGLNEITIPSSVTTIKNSAFSSCISLKNTTIPNSVTSIGDFAFSGCTDLTLRVHKNTYAHTWCLNNIVPFDLVHLPGNNCICVVCKGVSHTPNECCRCSACGEICHTADIRNICIFCGKTATYIFASGVCGADGDNLSWKLDSTGLLTIEGSGKMKDYRSDYTRAPWHSHRENIASAVIDSGVTSIGNAAFYDCDGLNGIVLPEGITSIGSYAFEDCSNLMNVILPDSLTTIGNYAFLYCYKLSNLVIYGSDMPSVGTYAFFESSPTVCCTALSDADYWAFENGYKTICFNDVSFPLAVTLPDDCTLDVGEAMFIVPDVFPPQENAQIVWTSSASDVVSVEGGLLTAHSVGEAVITATCSGKSDSLTVTTRADIRDFNIPAEIWIETKTTAQLTAQNIQPEGATGTFTWQSSNPATLSVSESGLLTALKPGDANVTVTSDSGEARQCLVHVCPPVTAIAFEQARLSLTVGKTAQLTARVTAGDLNLVNRLITFSCSDEAIAAVDESGVMTAIAPGTITITATSAGDVKDECTITIYSADALLLPEELAVIEAESFMATDAKTVIIPEGCVAIDSRAFADCGKLSLIVIPESVTAISNDAFDASESVIICAPSGSYAETFAHTLGIPFIAG